MGTDLAVAPKAEVLDREPTLEELAARVRSEHEACAVVAKTTLDHALRAGEALLEIRQRLMSAGVWSAWLRDFDAISRTHAYTYMRLATFREQLPDDVGIKQGEELLRHLPPLDSSRGRARLPDPMRQDAARLRKEGVGYKEIAKRLGVSPSTVHNWFNGSAVKHRREAAKALRAQKRRREVKRAVAKAGGGVG